MISIWVFIISAVGFIVMLAHAWYTNYIVSLRLDTLEEEFYNAYLVAQCYIEKYGEMSVEEMRKTKIIREVNMEMEEDFDEID